VDVRRHRRAAQIRRERAEQQRRERIERQRREHDARQARAERERRERAAAAERRRQQARQRRDDSSSSRVTVIRRRARPNPPTEHRRIEQRRRTNRRTTVHRRRTTTNRGRTTTNRRTTVHRRRATRHRGGVTVHRRHSRNHRDYTHRRTTVHRRHQSPGRIYNPSYDCDRYRRTTVVHRRHHRPTAVRSTGVFTRHDHRRSVVVHRGGPSVVQQQTTIINNQAAPAPSSRTHVVHNHYGSNPAPSPRNPAPPQQRQESQSDGGSNTEIYLTGMAGLSGFDSEMITFQPLPGVGYNLGLGVRGGPFATEFGFDMAGYRFDPAATASNDLVMLGMTADLKFQPAFGFFEPYVGVGFGGHVFNDRVLATNTVGGSMRLGLGADFRFDRVAINVHYLFNNFAMLDDEYSSYGRAFGAQTETLGVGMKLYF
jgi:opacity protein-like surface antigen